MGEYCNGETFTVKVKAKDRVAAALPQQDQRLSLSNLDLLLPPLDVGVFFCYKKNKLSAYSADFDAMVAALKASLAKTLVAYFPFSGEVTANKAGEPELHCNNRGVDFFVASADVELKELNLHDPDESVEKKLVPEKKGGVISIQVTKLKCGGMVLACTFDHRIADAYSTNMFLVSWAEISNMDVQGLRHKSKQATSKLPSFDRSLLSPRQPGRHDSSLDQLYMPISAIKMKSSAANDHANDNVAVNRIYYIASADLEQMQADASTGGERRSKLEAFSAYLWRVIGKGAKNRRDESCCMCRMGIVVNGRSRLTKDQQNQHVSLDNYFGNVLSIPYGSLEISDLENHNLSHVAGEVHEFLKEATTAEHFLGLVDWVEAHRPEPAAAKIYLDGAGDGEDDGVAFVVSSGRGFPVGELEFGWGRPVFGSYHFPWGGGAGYVMPMPSARGDGDWVVYMHLMKDLVEELEAEAGNIFRPLNAEYVDV